VIGKISVNAAETEGSRNGSWPTWQMEQAPSLPWWCPECGKQVTRKKTNSTSAATLDAPRKTTFPAFLAVAALTL